MFMLKQKLSVLLKKIKPLFISLKNFFQKTWQQLLSAPRWMLYAGVGIIGFVLISFIYLMTHPYVKKDESQQQLEVIEHVASTPVVNAPVQKLAAPVMAKDATLEREAFLKESEDMASQYALEINQLVTAPEKEKNKEEKLTPKKILPKQSLASLYANALTQHANKAANPYVKTLVFNANTRPILSFAPMQVGQIHLETGERITNMSLGDTDRWLLTQSYVGDEENGHVLILLKPKQTDIVTNLVIITNRRIYNFNVMAKADVFSPDVRFSYPNTSVNRIVHQSHALHATPKKEITKTVIDADHLNFNYTISGDHPSWEPTRVFDDGVHTMIAFDSMIDRVSLPVLFVYINGEPAMVNYRYQRPYIIVDRLFAHATLVSGKGKNKSEIEIFNKNVRGDA